MKTKELFKSSSKRIAVFAALLCVTIFAGCSKDDEEPSLGFSKAETEALKIMNGAFYYDGGTTSTTITFAPFSTPIKKKSTMNDVEMDFHGTLEYQSTYYDDSFYFYLDTDNRYIIAYAKHSEKTDYYNALVGKKWEYTIVDENTIKLFDTDLSDPLFQTNTFTRK